MANRARHHDPNLLNGQKTDRPLYDLLQKSHRKRVAVDRSLTALAVVGLAVALFWAIFLWALLG